jgi:hypothetical protein
MHPVENTVIQQLPRPSRTKAKVSIPITINVVEPVLPLDAKALLDVIQVCSQNLSSIMFALELTIVLFQQAKSSAKETSLQRENDEVWGRLSASSIAEFYADVQQPCVLACHTCPGLDDLTIFPDKVIENIGEFFLFSRYNFPITSVQSLRTSKLKNCFGC